MKNISFKTILVSCGVLAIANSSLAQDTVVTQKTVITEEQPVKDPLRIGEIGIRYMPTFSSIDLRTYSGDVVKGSAKLSNGFGVMLALNLGRHIGLQAEADYYQITQTYADRSISREVDINYIDVPILLSFNTDKSKWVNLNVVVGPQFGINAGSNIKTTGNENADTLRAVVALKQGDVGLAYGAGLEFALNPDHTFRLDLGYRGFYGLVDMQSTTTDAGTYNVVVKASRNGNAAYVGLTILF